MSKTILAKNVTVDNDAMNMSRNIFIEGASGSGKTRFIVKPNIMNCNESFVVTDPKGDLYKDTKDLLINNGYEIKVLNLYNPRKSNSYNPLSFIENSQDIKKISNLLVKETGCKDRFWIDSARNLFEAILYFLWETKGEYRDYHGSFNIATAKDLISRIEVDSRRGRSISGIITNGLIENYISQYPTSNVALAWKSFSSILDCSSTCACVIHQLCTELSVFDNAEILKITNKNDFDFTELKKKKCAYFVIVNDANSALYPLIASFYQQAITDLFDYSDHHKEQGEHVRFIFDDAFTNVKVPNLDALVSNCRSRNISFTLVSQSRSQLDSLYSSAIADTIVANCSSYVFLGTNDLHTAEYHARRANKKLDFIMSLDLNKCIVYVQGQLPRIVDKYDIKEHENYKYLNNERGSRC